MVGWEALPDYKIIQDPLNGPIKLAGVYEELIVTPELQRLRHIRSLGLCYLVFPGANHSRFEHSLGVMSLALEFAGKLGLDEPDIAGVAGFLHDVGHPPMSHGVEEFFRKETGLDHLQAGMDIVRGKGMFSGSSVPTILERHGLDPAEIAEVMAGRSKKHPVHSKIVSGPIDVDEMDYLRRDSLFCGVKLGLIDERRIMNIAFELDSDLVIEEKGIPAVESVLIARVLMYNSVYFHKTCRIAQSMLEKSLEAMDEDIPNPFMMRDHELLDLALANRGSAKLAHDIVVRNLFKPAARIPFSQEMFENVQEVLDSSYGKDQYILDIIPPVAFSGIDRVKSDLRVLSGNGILPLENLSPLVRALYETLEQRSIVVSAERDVCSKIINALSKFS